MNSYRRIGRAALMAAASAAVWVGSLAGAQASHATPGDHDYDPAPTTASVAPPAVGANPSSAPVNCTHPSNAVPPYPTNSVHC
jgi:hypothetical protein